MKHIMEGSLLVNKHERVNYKQGRFYNFVHTYYENDHYIEKHWHNSIEITYVVKGVKTQVMHKQKVLAKTGDILLVNSGVLHDVDVKYPFEGLVLLIDRDYMNNNFPKAVNRSFNLELDENAKSEIIQYLLKLDKVTEQGNKIRSHIFVLAIIDILVSRLMEEGHYIKEKHDDEVYELALNIAEYLEYYYASKINLDEIAKTFNYNKTYISSIFKKKMGITILEYLNNVRMSHVLDDLRNSKDSIVDIALTNGFANIQVFNKKFKNYYHMTPKEYRNKIKRNNNINNKK